MNHRNKLAVGGSVLAMVAVIAALAVVRPGGEDGASSESAQGEEMPRMEGMDMGGMSPSTDGSVQFTADEIRTFGITFGTAEQRTLEEEVRTVGIVGLDETRVAQVAPKFGGFVERLYVDFTGQPVRRGQPLMEIYSPELVAAQDELLLAAGLERSLGESAVPGVPAGSSDLLEAARRRLRLWDISDEQIDEVLRTGKVRRTMTLHAPVSGVVIEKNVLQGQAIQSGQTLYTIADLSEVWVEAELREADAAGVREGSEAILELAALPGRPIRGRVEYVYPTLQSEARTLKARIAVPNPEGRIKPGMYATVRIATPTRTALTAPSSAVVMTGERALVFVDMGGGRLMPHEVEVGQVAGDYTEILSGVEPGKRVVTSAQFLLDSESNLAEVMKSMMGMTDEGMEMDMGGMEGMDTSGDTMQRMDMQGAEMKGMQMPQPEEP